MSSFWSMPPWLLELLPIAILLAVVTLLVNRLPRIDVGHSPAFLRRRFLNWFPVGMTYAFLYMGRYNLNACKNALGDAMSKDVYGTITFWGTLTYGVAFLLNGPLTDRWGGRATMLIAAGGTLVMNVAMGMVLLLGKRTNLTVTYSLLYAGNMYFQSFGAVSIVKVNSAWFHLRERGTFGGIFGILISLGIYFAYDWSRLIAQKMPIYWVFFVPAIILAFFFVWDYFVVRDTPKGAGLEDFDTADAGSPPDADPKTYREKPAEPGRLPVFEVAKRMLKNPVIITIALVEFCSGYLRNALMQWYPIFAKETGIDKTFVPAHWGMLLCVAGILGGVVAGVLSDRLFQSRRGPMSAILYGSMVVGILGAFFVLKTPALGWLMVILSLCIIGVHGMLSGTASMDFGGKANVGVAVGIIDGLVYLGTAAQALVLGNVLPKGLAAKQMAPWMPWIWAMLPPAIIGTLLATRLWNARASRGSAH